MVLTVSADKLHSNTNVTRYHSAVGCAGKQTQRVADQEGLMAIELSRSIATRRALTMGASLLAGTAWPVRLHKPPRRLHDRARPSRRAPAQAARRTRSSSPAIARACASSTNAKREFDRLHRLDLRRGHRQVPRHQHRRIVQPHPRHHDHPRDHRRGPEHRDPRPRHQLHQGAAERRAGRGRLDRPHRQRRTPTARSISTCSRPSCSPS